MNFDFHAPSHAHVELDSSLHQLEQAELVRQLFEQELAYLFKHALVQDSAYSTLLIQQRKRLHELVATSLIDTYPEKLDENAARLAQHYAQAGDDEKTFEYATRAGDVATRVFAYPEARVHYTDALSALERLPNNDENRRDRAEILVKLVTVSLRSAGPEETLKRLAQAEMLAQPFAERADATREDRLRLARIHFWQGHALLHHNNPRAAMEKMRQVVAVARAENDSPLLASPASIIGRSLFLQGHFAQAEPILSDAVRALEETHDEHEWIFASGLHGSIIALRGEPVRGIAEAERTLNHAQALGSLTGISVAHFILGLTYLLCGFTAEAAEHARAIIETAARSGDRFHAYLGYSYLAWAQIRAHALDDADKSDVQAQAIAQTIGGRLAVSDWFMTARVEYHLRRGEIAKAIALAEQAIAIGDQTGSILVSGWAHRLCGQALSESSQANNSVIENHFASALALFSEGDVQIEVARTQLAWGIFLRARGDENSAREHLEKAAAQFEAFGFTRELQATRELLSHSA